jgi:retinol dehydrogenase-12
MIVLPDPLSSFRSAFSVIRYEGPSGSSGASFGGSGAGPPRGRLYEGYSDPWTCYQGELVKVSPKKMTYQGPRRIKINQLRDAAPDALTNHTSLTLNLKSTPRTLSSHANRKLESRTAQIKKCRDGEAGNGPYRRVRVLAHINGSRHASNLAAVYIAEESSGGSITANKQKMSSFAIFKQNLRNLYVKADYTEKDYPDQSGRVFVVTGGPTGIGFQVSRYLVMKNAKVWLVARNQSKIDEAIENLKEEFPNANVDYFIVDFADLTTIKPGVQKFLDSESRLDGIVHNAGVMVPPAGSKTKQGYELQLGVNTIGPFLLQKFLDDIFIKSAKSSPENSSRILWVSSSAQFFAPTGGINWHDINFEKGGVKTEKYGQSKAINIFECIMWAKKHPDSGVVCLTCDPGNIRSELQRHANAAESLLMKYVLYPTHFGAYTELYAMLHPSFTVKESGTFVIPFGARGVIRNDIETAAKGEAGEKLWSWMEEQVAAYL